jgi:hypothetical protein
MDLNGSASYVIGIVLSESEWGEKTYLIMDNVLNPL